MTPGLIFPARSSRFNAQAQSVVAINGLLVAHGLVLVPESVTSLA
jgi:hypothetical protein